jgi:hypothetical protein
MNLIIDSADRNWIQHESTTSFTIKFSAFSQSIRDVATLTIDRILLPNRSIQPTYLSNTTIKISDIGILLVRIDNMTDAMKGTNKTLDGVISAMTPVIEALPSQQYLEFTNANKQIKTFNPPVIMDKFTIQLLTPTGISPHNFNDILSIKRIFSSYDNPSLPSNTAVITIRTSTYFNNNEYKIGDIIYIRDYIFHNNTNNECYIFNNFINRITGHYIGGIGKSDSSTVLYNEIYIAIPQYNDINTGNLVYDTWYSDFLTKNDFSDITDDSTGTILNTALQTRIFITIST